MKVANTVMENDKITTTKSLNQQWSTRLQYRNSHLSCSSSYHVPYLQPFNIHVNCNKCSRIFYKFKIRRHFETYLIIFPLLKENSWTPQVKNSRMGIYNFQILNSNIEKSVLQQQIGNILNQSFLFRIASMLSILWLLLRKVFLHYLKFKVNISWSQQFSSQNKCSAVPNQR